MVSLILFRKFGSIAAAATPTTSAALITTLHRKTPSTTIFPTLSARAFATNLTKDDQENNEKSDNHSKRPLVITGPPEAFKYEHPFQIQGSKEVVEVDDTKDGTLVSLALPGVGENGYKVWVEGHTVFFQARADVDFNSDQPRTYGGSLEFRLEYNNAHGVKAEIKNGILKLLVPNAQHVNK